MKYIIRKMVSPANNTNTMETFLTSRRKKHKITIKVDEYDFIVLFLTQHDDSHNIIAAVRIKPTETQHIPLINDFTFSCVLYFSQ